ncbi:hypothetical protein AAFF_G00353700 [Aldrovandia affinis]|uniref:Uncharacterized protein n=1 Tax=Aldrovandia affinis TaxID=143900 RepID=A0AAD7R5S3_9TELE|nr:hypothetical protein AAFF_G00353700 [Aldrovandia affinis]
MSLAVDETAGDLPVRDVGLRDRRRVFRVSREQLEEQCLRLQEENTLLRQHTRTQDQRLRRMSTKLLSLRERCPGSAGLREGELEEAVQELEVRVATLESQKGALQSKLSLARQHILDLGEEANTEPEIGGVRTERAECSVIETQQVRVTELELAAQTLRDTLREKEREIEDTTRDLRRQQADGHRVTIRESVDMIRLQKQLSDKSTALLVIQEKFSVLQEVYEEQLAESQKPLKQSQEALLEKAEELTEQLKQERQRALCLEGQLTTAAISAQVLEELQERLSDVEGERDLLKEAMTDCWRGEQRGGV